jgi:tRNA1(Val) A37 N6-methylase TrmN6
VLINPPFNDPGRHNASPDPDRRAAHLGEALMRWLATAARLLRRQGSLTLIFRADGLAHVLAAVDADFGAIAIAPVYPQRDKAAIRIVVSAIKGAHGPLALRQGLLLNDNGGPAAAAEAILRDGAALALRDIG